MGNQQESVSINQLDLLSTATSSGFDNWIEEGYSGRGWHKCVLTGKSFRGQAAYSMLDRQRQYIEDKMKTGGGEINRSMVASISGEELNKYLSTKYGEDVEISAALMAHLGQKLAQNKQINLGLITCEDCGQRRVIKIQDAHQVTRCEKHQQKARRERLNARHRDKRSKNSENKGIK